ncbi:AbrB family transcriptional regulator [Ensifer sp. IC3342]|nr:AbrB family transcriptional regulator [Ensifer sp. BRP08]MCA1451076.1 AbrB family transcriptional regulator [Ensifer sp. IC3342]
MSASAILHLMGLTQFAPPTAARAVAQVVIGATIGCRFAMARPRKTVEVRPTGFTRGNPATDSRASVREGAPLSVFGRSQKRHRAAPSTVFVRAAW